MVKVCSNPTELAFSLVKIMGSKLRKSLKCIKLELNVTRHDFHPNHTESLETSMQSKFKVMQKARALPGKKLAATLDTDPSQVKETGKDNLVVLSATEM